MRPAYNQDVAHKTFNFLLAAVSVFCLASCGESSSADSTGSDSSSSAKTRPEVLTVLKKFSANNGVNTIDFRFIADDTATSTAIKPVTAKASVTYVKEGYEVKFLSGWDDAKKTYGYLNMPSDNTLSKAAGVYGYSIGTVTSSSSKGESAIVLGEAVSTTVTDVYAYYQTPKYIYDNASTLAPLFATTDRSEYNRCTDVASTEAMAKALNVYNVVKSAVPTASFAYVELNYSASSTAFTYTFYITYNGVNYIAARAVLSNFGAAKNATLADYLTSITPEKGA